MEEPTKASKITKKIAKKQARLENSEDLIYEFLLDPQSRKQPPVWNEDLGMDELPCFDDDYYDYIPDSR